MFDRADLTHTLTTSELRAVMNGLAIFTYGGGTCHVKLVGEYELTAVWNGEPLLDWASDDDILAAFEKAKSHTEYLIFDAASDRFLETVATAVGLLEGDPRYLSNFTVQTQDEADVEDEAESEWFVVAHKAEYDRIDALEASIPEGQPTPHYITAMYMAVGASPEECEEIDHWKDAAKEGY